MKSRTVYQTDHLGLYVGPTEAEESPLEPGVFLIPGGCVSVPPPTDIPQFKAALWNGKAWQLVDYFKGLIVYDTSNRTPLTINGLGPIPNGYTMMPPEPDQVWKNGRWVDDLNTQVAKLYPMKLALITDGCAGYIVAGFSSDALGESHHYDSALEDQVNLAGLIISGLSGLCPCIDPAGDQSLREHSAEQLHVVGQHLATFKQRALQQAQSLKKSLSRMLEDKDLDAMKAMQWSPPQ